MVNKVSIPKEQGAEVEMEPNDFSKLIDLVKSFMITNSINSLIIRSYSDGTGEDVVEGCEIQIGDMLFEECVLDEYPSDYDEDREEFYDTVLISEEAFQFITADRTDDMLEICTAYSAYGHNETEFTLI